MNYKFILNAFIAINVFNIIGLINGFECPDASAISPCICSLNQKSILCAGSNVKHIPFDTFNGTEYYTLYINATNITEIGDHWLMNNIWQKIIIANNPLLTKISENIKSMGPQLTVWFENNTQLNGDQIFNVIKKFNHTERIIVANSNVRSLPANPFRNNTNLRALMIFNNNIQTINSNTFLGPKNLEYVRLDHNRIREIADYALNFSPNGTIFRRITVLLNDNELSDDSFTSETFSRQNDVEIDLDLGHNDLTAIDEEVFGPFLRNGKNQLWLDGNDFNCDCDIVWLLNDSNRNSVHSVACRHPLKSLFNLNSEEQQEVCPPSTLQVRQAAPEDNETIATNSTTTSQTPTTLTPTPTTLTPTPATLPPTTLLPPDTTLPPTPTTTISFHNICLLDINSCTCDEESKQYKCIGDTVDNNAIKKIGSKFTATDLIKFELFELSNTNISKIEKRSLSNLNFTSLIIEDNQHLVDIASEAFVRLQIATLTARKNPRLNGDSLFELARRLSPHQIDFSGNSIESVPESAFVDAGLNAGLSRVILDSNQITAIESQAFDGLPALTYVSIRHNRLTAVNDYGLRFGPTQGLVTIYLSDNNLTADGLSSRSISLSPNVTLRLDLERNRLTTLRQKVFAHYLDRVGSRLDVFGNAFNCTCDMSWVLPYENIFNVKCENKMSSIFDLDDKDWTICRT